MESQENVVLLQHKQSKNTSTLNRKGKDYEHFKKDARCV